MFNTWSNETECGIYASRFIASWIRMGGSLCYGKDYDDFEEWLNSLTIDGKHLSEQDVNHILELARNGKMELEYSVKAFLKKKQ